MTKHLEKVEPLKILLYDIEATNLNADFGFVLCIAWKWAHEQKTHHVSITQSPHFKRNITDDSWVIQKFAKVVEKADIIVHHYGSKFDYPYLQTRALLHGQFPLPPVQDRDTWRLARDYLHLSSNRLANLTGFLGLGKKTPLSGTIWVRATSGHRLSICYVVEHCVQDVVVLGETWDRIKALNRKFPNVYGANRCAVCGWPTQSRGTRVTHKNRIERQQCGRCGHWQDGKSYPLIRLEPRIAR